MRYDLTRAIGEDTMVYPGAECVRLRATNTVERDGFRETLLSISSHTGTHMDAPAHMIAGGACLDALPPDAFFGRAYVMDAARFSEGGAIDVCDLPPLVGVDFLLISTGWEEKWGTDAYFGRFPVLTEAAAAVLARMGLKGVGVDLMSVDPMDGSGFPVHLALLGAGLVILENLHRLIPLRGRTVELAALPLKYEGADGAPARVIATLT